MTANNNKQFGLPDPQGLYHPSLEHDACGVGFLANVHGEKSHTIVERGIEVLKNLLHRGAAGSDPETGDGAGLLIQVPDAYFRDVLPFDLPQAGHYGVGMLFLPREKAPQKACIEAFSQAVEKETDLQLLGWREMPVDPGVLGQMAQDSMPHVMQVFVSTGNLPEEEAERRLYVLRRQAELAVKQTLGKETRFYVASLSCRTIVYKGLMMATQVPGFYKELADERLTSALAIVHQRYSTNTFPSWELAQPFRYLAHNGEINTLRGNLNWMKSREPNLTSDYFGDDIKKLLPIIEDNVSDSAALDNALELITNCGRTLDHSMVMLIPQAWGQKYPMGPDLRGFFEYHSRMMEPWDGPASVAFTNGKQIGALLDRNGLRPARYTLTKEGFIVFASEAGVLDLPPESIAEKGALRPGQILLVDLEQQRVMKDTEVKMHLARRQPYRRWVDENSVTIHGLFSAVAPVQPDEKTLLFRQRLFGYSREDLRFILEPMATQGHEPIGSMGTDEPLAVLSEQPQLLYWYFKQLFAQITNPAIDPIREELVMSLMTFIGCTDNILNEAPGNAHVLKLQHPILSNEDLARIRTLHHEGFETKTLEMGFPAGGDGDALRESLDALCQKAADAIKSGHNLIVLSDRDLPEHLCPIPALLAVSAVNRYLVGEGLRTNIGIILETGEAREVMHMAVLLGYGASAINPYLAYETIAHMVNNNSMNKSVSGAKAIENYTKAVCKGLLKVMSKSGISTLRSYRSAQVFEAVGLNQQLVDAYFSGTQSRIGGIGLNEVAREANARHEAAATPATPISTNLPSGGHYALRKDGERHLWTPDSIHYLQQATRKNDYDLYKTYAGLINHQEKKQSTLRGLFKFKKTKTIPLSEVEPAAEIAKRFVTGAMSYGSISQEAHETLAIAMNRIGGMSNSGEGGEDPERFIPLPNGDSRESAIKQIASGRFGVTAEYLVHARDLQIKIAQGAKPGEGGQLPGFKVLPWIAKTRHSTPYVTLISPPPHHDIYSIEDIAQLIYDLKNANPEARISVKLVAEVGVGTIAAGVAKAHADMILISGYDGGTGASPLSSLKHAGVPWELGLSETQQTLVLNDLRSRVRLQTDGQLKTGRDVIIAAMLGAEEFGFATAALVVCGCVMMRKCHKNTCPVGVATQDPELRKFYSGSPDYVVNFMLMLAEEAREIMAELGIRSIDELVGRSDLLEMNDAIKFWKTEGLDISKILYRPDARPDEIRKSMEQDHGLDGALDYDLMPQAEPAIEKGEKVVIEQPIRNVNRTVGTLLSNQIAKKYGHTGLPDDTLTLKFKGSAGQSFAAFCSRGMTFHLEGEANDYLGKGLSGAKIIVKPEEGIDFDPTENMIVGNVLLYGATCGEVYINGRAGERFAIRNSGALAVVEGVGDHGCEYMTGGRVVILGPTGVNFGAGMSGGIAYVYDETGMFDDKCNLGMIDLELVIDPEDQQELRQLIERHVAYTGSRRGQHILDHWDTALAHFIKVFPMDYKRALGQMRKDDEETEREPVVND